MRRVHFIPILTEAVVLGQWFDVRCTVPDFQRSLERRGEVSLSWVGREGEQGGELSVTGQIGGAPGARVAPGVFRSAICRRCGRVRVAGDEVGGEEIYSLHVRRFWSTVMWTLFTDFSVQLRTSRSPPGADIFP